jgi:hypothetical protein
MYVRNVADCKKIEYVIKIKSTNIPITHVNHLFLTFNVLDTYCNSKTYWVIQNDCGQLWQLCTKMYVATV